MITIDTWTGLATALASSLPPAALSILNDTAARLEEFRDQPLSELCTILILEPPDRLDFPFDPASAEYIDHHDGWYEMVFVTGDDGHGFVVLLEDHPGTDQALLDLCRAHQTT